MKKIIALLISLIIGATFLTGCTNNEEVFTQKSYTSEEKEISEILIDVRDRQIEVIQSSDNQIKIDYFESSKEYYNISVSDNQVLTMTYETDKSWLDYIGKKPADSSRTILLQVPEALIKVLNLSTTNENISLSALSAIEDVILSSKGGDITFDKLNVKNKLDLTAKNGDITGSINGNYEDYKISCTIKKGNSNLPSSKETGIKTLNVSNNNGDIEINFLSE